MTPAERLRQFAKELELAQDTYELEAAACLAGAEALDLVRTLAKMHARGAAAELIHQARNLMQGSDDPR